MVSGRHDELEIDHRINATDPDSDSDPSKSYKDDTPDPDTYGTYNPTAVRPTRNPPQTNNQQSKSQTALTDSIQTHSNIQLTQPFHPQ